MKKFITRGACFAVIGLALLFVLNSFYIRTNGYKSLNGTYKFTMVPDNIDVMNLGSSHGEFGLDYEGVDSKKGFNFGLRGQSFYFDLQLLKRYSDRLVKGCVVIIPLSYFSFIQANDHNDVHVVYYSILDYGSIPNHDLVEYIRYKALPLLSASFDIVYLLKDKERVDSDLFASGSSDVEHYSYTAMRDRGYYDAFAALNEQNPNDRENERLLGEMIAYCQERGLKPVMITTPYTEYYHYWFPAELTSGFYASVQEICAKYGVPYLDYSHDPRFTTSLEWFGDSDHLNPAGRKIFTNILLTDLGMI